MRKQFFSFVATLVLTALASSVHAQPSLKMMIPANPGGGWDQTGRPLAAAMQSAKLVSSCSSITRAAPAARSAWRNSSTQRKAIPMSIDDRRHGHGRRHLS